MLCTSARRTCVAYNHTTPPSTIQCTRRSKRAQEDAFKAECVLQAERKAHEDVQKSLENYIEVLTEEINMLNEAAMAGKSDRRRRTRARTGSFAVPGAPCTACQGYRAELLAATERRAGLEGEVGRLSSDLEGARDKLLVLQADLESLKEGNAVLKEEHEQLAAMLAHLVAKLPVAHQREVSVTSSLQRNLELLSQHVTATTTQV